MKGSELQSLGGSLSVEGGCLKVFPCSWSVGHRWDMSCSGCAYVHIPFDHRHFWFSVRLSDRWRQDFYTNCYFFLDFSELILHSQQC